MMNLGFIHKRTSLMSKKKKELVEHIMWLEHNNSALKNSIWIPCSEKFQKFPENEQEVEITYIRQHYKTGEVLYQTARAFYEDGTLTTEESNYSWHGTDNWEYDEKTDSLIIPEGWFESVSFTDEFGIVDMPVIAWRPLTEPYRGKEQA